MAVRPAPSKAVRLDQVARSLAGDGGRRSARPCAPQPAHRRIPTVIGLLAHGQGRRLGRAGTHPGTDLARNAIGSRGGTGGYFAQLTEAVKAQAIECRFVRENPVGGWNGPVRRAGSPADVRGSRPEEAVDDVVAAGFSHLVCGCGSTFPIFTTPLAGTVRPTLQLGRRPGIRARAAVLRGSPGSSTWPNAGSPSTALAFAKWRTLVCSYHLVWVSSRCCPAWLKID